MAINEKVVNASEVITEVPMISFKYKSCDDGDPNPMESKTYVTDIFDRYFEISVPGFGNSGDKTFNKYEETSYDKTKTLKTIHENKEVNNEFWIPSKSGIKSGSIVNEGLENITDLERNIKEILLIVEEQSSDFLSNFFRSNKFDYRYSFECEVSSKESIHRIENDFCDEGDNLKPDFSKLSNYSDLSIPLHIFIVNPVHGKENKKPFNQQLAINTKTNVYQHTMMDDDFSDLMERVASFKNWPKADIARPSLLTKAGFYFTGEADIVACFSCNGKVYNWSDGWDPMKIHRKFYSHCEFIKGLERRENEAAATAPLRVMNVSRSTDSQTASINLSSLENGDLDVKFPPTEIKTDHRFVSLPNLEVGNKRSYDTTSNQHDSDYDRPISLVDQRPKVANTGSSNGASGGAATLRYFLHPPDEKGKLQSIPQVVNVRERLSETIEKAMVKEADRVSTFDKWPKSAIVNPRSLAKAGFYSTRRGDETKCAFCALSLTNWTLGDRAIDEHKKHRPTCPFMLNLDVGNVPITDNVTNGSLPVQNEPPRRIPVPDSGPPASAFERLSIAEHAEPKPNDEDAFGKVITVPKRKEFQDYNSRLDTYERWDPNNNQSSEALAEAGFLYSGLADNVRCFHCGGGLRAWEKLDDPWREHARWFPRCGFLRQVKRFEFVKQVQIEVQQRNDANQELQMNTDASSEPMLRIETDNQSLFTSGISIGNTTEDDSSNTNRELTSGGNAPTIPATVESASAALDADLETIAICNHVEPREVRARMDTHKVQLVLKMGYPRSLLEYAVYKSLAETGDDYKDPQSLMEAVVQLEPLHKKGGDTLLQDLLKRGLEKAKLFPRAEPVSSNIGRIQTGPPTSATSTKQGTKSAPAVSENKPRSDDRTCRICMDKEIGVVFVPCGHFMCCTDCAAPLRMCPLCRAVIRQSVRTFLP